MHGCSVTFAAYARACDAEFLHARGLVSGQVFEECNGCSGFVTAPSRWCSVDLTPPGGALCRRLPWRPRRNTHSHGRRPPSGWRSRAAHFRRQLRPNRRSSGWLAMPQPHSARSRERSRPDPGSAGVSLKQLAPSTDAWCYLPRRCLEGVSVMCSAAVPFRCSSYSDR